MFANSTPVAAVAVAVAAVAFVIVTVISSEVVGRLEGTGEVNRYTGEDVTKRQHGEKWSKIVDV